jgi:flavin-dependent dehydrogenase
VIARPACANPRQWDVIIVGAGPAGCALATRLRPRHRVLLLDRASAAGDAAASIGESLPGGAGVLLKRLGMLDHFLAQGHANRGAAVSAWELDQATWFDAVRDPQGAGWHLDRRRFDAGMRACALAAGVSLIDDVQRLHLSHAAGPWRVDFESGAKSAGTAATTTYHARVLVDASGARMAAARQLGLVRHGQDKLVCLYAHVPVGADDTDQATRTCADSNGWWYSVRVPSGQRVLAFHLDSDDEELRALRDPAQLLFKSQRHPLLRMIRPTTLDFSVHARAARGGRILPDALARLPPGFFAIGDAMLSFDPIASQGIFNALATAESAALAIDGYLDGVDGTRERNLAEASAVHDRYRQRLRQTYGAVRRYRRERFWQRRTGGDAADVGSALRT